MLLVQLQEITLLLFFKFLNSKIRFRIALQQCINFRIACDVYVYGYDHIVLGPMVISPVLLSPVLIVSVVFILVAVSVFLRSVVLTFRRR